MPIALSDDRDFFGLPFFEVYQIILKNYAFTKGLDLCFSFTSLSHPMRGNPKEDFIAISSRVKKSLRLVFLRRPLGRTRFVHSCTLIRYVPGIKEAPRSA